VFVTADLEKHADRCELRDLLDMLDILSPWGFTAEDE
jgi:hypothetical protein